MIATNIAAPAPGGRRPLLRVREERVGGRAFYPDSGKVVSLSEEELAHWRDVASSDPAVAYYACREWGADDLAQGCGASPNRIYLEVTQGCNLKCCFCYRNAGSAGEAEMDTGEQVALIRSLAAMGVHELRLTGGEPTTRRDLPELVDEAIAAGLFVTLGSNGVVPDHALDALCARALGRYLISLDGVQLVHEALRGMGSFDRAVRTVRRLLAEGKNVRINTVLCRRNLACLPTFLDWCAGIGVRNVSLIVPRPLGRAGAPAFDADMVGPREMEAVARLAGTPHPGNGMRIEFQYDVYRQGGPRGDGDPVISKVFSCPAGVEAAFISPEGLMYVCGCAAEWLSDPGLRRRILAGSVRNLDAQNIWDLWQQAPVWRAFRNPTECKDPACFECAHYGRGCFGSCPVHAFASGGSFNAPDPMCWLGRSAARRHSIER